MLQQCILRNLIVCHWPSELVDFFQNELSDFLDSLPKQDKPTKMNIQGTSELDTHKCSPW